MRPASAIPWDRIERVLLLRLRSLGDCVLMTPVLRLLKEQCPWLSLSVLVERPFLDVFRGSPHLDRLHVLERPGGGGSRLISRWQTVRAIRREHPDLVLNMHGGTTSLFFAVTSGARFRAGFSHYRHARAYTHRVSDPAIFFGGRPLHTIEFQAGLLAGLGLALPGVLPPAEFFIQAEARDQAVRRLAGLGVEPGTYVLIHPTATLPTKQWPPAAFARLVDLIRQGTGLPVVLTTGPGEDETARIISGRLARPVSWLSGLSVGELAAVIDHAKVFAGCDSGPAHIAAALEKPVVSIWGSSNVRAWQPRCTRCRVVRHPLPCNPCPGYSCPVFGHPRCIEEIHPEEVFAALQELLAGTPA